jgi:hypothetical protein
MVNRSLANLKIAMERLALTSASGCAFGRRVYRASGCLLHLDLGCRPAYGMRPILRDRLRTAWIDQPRRSPGKAVAGNSLSDRRAYFNNSSLSVPLLLRWPMG